MLGGQSCTTHSSILSLLTVKPPPSPPKRLSRAMTMPSTLSIHRWSYPARGLGTPSMRSMKSVSWFSYSSTREIKCCDQQVCVFEWVCVCVCVCVCLWVGVDGWVDVWMWVGGWVWVGVGGVCVCVVCVWAISRCVCVYDSRGWAAATGSSDARRAPCRGRRSVRSSRRPSYPERRSRRPSSRQPVAIGETVILLQPPLPLVGVSMGMERWCQQNDSLAEGQQPARCGKTRCCGR